MQRFVDGINAYIDWLQANPERMPWEFTFLGYRPAKWTAEDVIRIRSHGLTRNLNSEVARANTLCKTKDVEVDQVRFGLTNDWKAHVPEGLDPCLPGRPEGVSACDAGRARYEGGADVGEDPGRRDPRRR